MKRSTIIAISAIFILGLLVSSVYSSAQDIKQRMIERLPTITALKAKGLVGEDNRGYLQFIGKKKENEDVVAAENKDRQTVYTAIAKQQGTTVELVGQHRAIQIADKALAGEWLQDAGGKWYQK